VFNLKERRRKHGFPFPFCWVFHFMAVILLAMVTDGCAHRYYDADHNDYHRWNGNERVYYNQCRRKS
jgi:hypothetical protein